jgi:hypothetical protein
MKKSTLLKPLLYLGTSFFLFEAVLHFFGLEVLEHDKIFLFTHDRYIALYALTQAFLLILCATNFKKYHLLLGATLVGLGLAMINAAWIAAEGGYDVLFPTVALDQSLQSLGLAFTTWYLATCWLYVASKPQESAAPVKAP